jgi:RNA polymerase sigma-70 factor, ECF subfamily
VLVNGAVGMIGMRDGQPVSVFSPVIRGGRIVEINILADPERLAALDLDDLI